MPYPWNATKCKKKQNVTECRCLIRGMQQSVKKKQKCNGMYMPYPWNTTKCKLKQKCNGTKMPFSWNATKFKKKKCNGI